MSFWTEGLDNLYKDGNYLIVIPQKNMTTNEQYNALTRLCIYIIIIASIFSLDNAYIMYPIILIIIIVYLKYNTQDDNKNIEKYTEKKRVPYRKTKRIHKRITDDNPFMNPNIGDYELNAFNNQQDDLYMHFDDAFDKYNSNRQFYTVSSPSFPNDQMNFANWVYKPRNTCKTNQEECLRYEDLRFKRNS